ADGGGGERLHLHAGAAAALHGGDERDLAFRRVERELRRDARERDGVRERDERRGLLGRLDRGDARHAEHVALFRAALDYGAEGGGAHRDAPRGDRDAVRFVLAAHVHHVRAPLAV